MLPSLASCRTSGVVYINIALTDLYKIHFLLAEASDSGQGYSDCPFFIFNLPPTPHGSNFIRPEYFEHWRGSG